MATSRTLSLLGVVAVSATLHVARAHAAASDRVYTPVPTDDLEANHPGRVTLLPESKLPAADLKSPAVVAPAAAGSQPDRVATQNNFIGAVMLPLIVGCLSYCLRYVPFDKIFVAISLLLILYVCVLCVIPVCQRGSVRSQWVRRLSKFTLPVMPTLTYYYKAVDPSLSSLAQGLSVLFFWWFVGHFIGVAILEIVVVPQCLCKDAPETPTATENRPSLKL